MSFHVMPVTGRDEKKLHILNLSFMTIACDVNSNLTETLDVGDGPQRDFRSFTLFNFELRESTQSPSSLYYMFGLFHYSATEKTRYHCRTT